MLQPLQRFWQRDYMGIQKDIKGAWRDSKKFAKKHPVVAVLIGGAGTITLLGVFADAYFTTKLFEAGYK